MGLKSKIHGLVLLLGLSLCSSPSSAYDLASSVKPRERKSSSKSSSSKNRKGNPATSLLTLGVHGFSNYLYPTLTYELGITRWLSLGLTGLYSKSHEGSSDALLYGGYGSVNLYLGHGEFRGLWLHMGYGAWSFEAKAAGETERFFRTVTMATIGFRGMFENFLRIGASGGLLHLTPGKLNSRLLSVEVPDTVPVMAVEVGFGF